MKIYANETPIRTAKNFSINNVEVNIPKIQDENVEFGNVNIDYKDSTIDREVLNKDTVYGNGEYLESEIEKKSNSKIRINLTREVVKLDYNFDDNNTTLINKLDIVAKYDSDIIIVYNSNTSKECYHNGIINIIAQDGANLNVTLVNFLNEDSYNFDAIQTEIYDMASVNVSLIDLGAKYSIINYYSNCISDMTQNNIKTIYIGRENQVKDMNYIVHMNGKKSKADIDVQGAISDNCKKSFKGTIDFKKGCKKACGRENEFCLLLSKNARSISLPMLLATEEDVVGNHSSASGKVDDEMLFYIMSRGFNYSDAIKLIVKARFSTILENLNDEKIIDEINQRIDRGLKNGL